MKKGTKLALLWVVAGLPAAYGLVLIATTLLCSLLGGPLDPPPEMTWHQFQPYLESGQWFRDSMLLGTGCIVIPFVTAVLFTLLMNRKTQNKAMHVIAAERGKT